MKTTPVRLTLIATAFLLGALSGRADATARAQIVKERDRVLTQILADREGRRSAGTADEEAIAAAQLALYSFRRDVAATPEEKIKQQELIVRVHEKKSEHLKGLQNTGVVGRVQVLEAQAALLEARQVLEELRPDERKG